MFWTKIREILSMCNTIYMPSELHLLIIQEKLLFYRIIHELHKFPSFYCSKKLTKQTYIHKSLHYNTQAYIFLLSLQQYLLAGLAMPSPDHLWLLDKVMVSEIRGRLCVYQVMPCSIKTHFFAGNTNRVCTLKNKILSVSAPS